MRLVLPELPVKASVPPPNTISVPAPKGLSAPPSATTATLTVPPSRFGVPLNELLLLMMRVPVPAPRIFFR
jgi:hypothetical protein